MKKILIFGVIIAIAAFFTLPSLIFADTDDIYTVKGETDGQYQMDSDDPDSDPDVDVYCMDNRTGYNTGTEAYKETDQYVSDVLQVDGGNGTDPVSADNAEAVEIMATTATGATDSENQDIVWDLIEGGYTLTDDGKTVEAEVLALAKEFNDYGLNNDTDPLNDVTLQQFLDAKNVNELDVVLDDDPLVDENGDYNDFTAEAIMAEPLAPGVTDGDTFAEGTDLATLSATGTRTVIWVILEDSFNVSFSEFDLVTETTSNMYDVDANGNDDDFLNKDSGDYLNTALLEDNYGYTSVPYYFYWWGAGFPEYEEMYVNIGACVDIDGDKALDKSEEEAKAMGDAIVQTIKNPDYIPPKISDERNLDYPGYDGPYNSPHVVEKDPDGIVVTGQSTILPFDVYENEGGKVLQVPEFGTGYQRFTIENYSEPCDSDENHYCAYGNLTVCKTDSSTGLPVNGAVYKLTYVGGQTYTPKITEYSATTGEDGVGGVCCIGLHRLVLGDSLKMISIDGTITPDGCTTFSCLPWGEWELTEYSAPPGYYTDTTTYTRYIGGSNPAEGSPLHTIYYEEEPDPTVSDNIDVTDDPIPPYTPPTDPPTTPPTTTTTVAGIIEVAGISELPFTGMNPIIPLSGISIMVIGAALLIASLIRRKRIKKMEA